MQAPTERGWFVYTKENCSYCTKVKTILPENTMYISADTYDRTDFLNMVDAYTGKTPRTFPMVFLNGLYMGGHAETSAYIDDLNNFAL